MFYKELDLPPIPDHFLNNDLFSIIKNVSDIGYGYRHYQNGILLNPVSYKLFELLDNNFKDWLKTHAVGLLPGQQVVLQEQEAPIGKIGTHIVHSDLFRFFALNYIIDTGGDNVVTNWYQEKGFPLNRRKTRGGEQSDNGFVDYENLELLDSVVMKKSTWYLLDVRVLHDVQNISECRKSISLGYRNLILDHMTLK